MLKKSGSILLALLLCISLAACGIKQEDTRQDGSGTVISDGETVGEGKISFTVQVTDADAKAVTFTVRTDEKTVGEALQKLGIIDGEEGDYGLYIKTVNGITADYDADGSYWAFYVNGAYAMAGTDMTDCTEGAAYAFAVEKM